MSQRSGHPYRLLSEAQYEYASRAGSQAAYSWGNSTEGLSEHANGWVEAVKAHHRFTSPVGSFKPNAFGLYDMTGNVWCWTQDWWNDSYEGAPDDGSARTTGDRSRRVVRGGAWDDLPRELRVAYRGRVNAAIANNRRGFRLARTEG